MQCMITSIGIREVIGDDDMPFYSMEAMIPFQHIIEAEQITENCVYYMRADLEQLSTTMIDSDEIEAKIVINLNALVMKQREIGIIQNIAELVKEKFGIMKSMINHIGPVIGSHAGPGALALSFMGENK